VRLSARELAARRGGRAVFSGLSFTVSGGEVLAVTGPNGAGKSTLLRLVAGLLQPEAGTIVAEPEPADGIAGAVHYLGHLDGLKPALTVAENLAFFRTIAEGEETVAAALDAVGLGDLAGFPAGVLSAGQKRRVAIARLLVARRPIWLLDEPTTALDAAAEADLGRLIATHAAEGGIVIAATHRGLPVTPSATLDLGGAI
jgi:heme exporter protein A